MAGASGTIYVENIAEVMATYTSIRVYRGSTSDPNTAVFTSEVSTIALVADQEQYAFEDGFATVNTLWRFSYYKASPLTESSLGPIVRPSNQTTLRLLRIEGARLAGAGSRGTCTLLGTGTTLVDARLAMSGHDVGFSEGSWIYRPDADVATDKLRRVDEGGFAKATGTLTIPEAYPWQNPPELDEAYHIFNWFPPIEAPGEPTTWDDIVRDALNECWFRDQVNIGNGTSTGQTRFPVGQLSQVIDPKRIYNIWFRRIDENTGFVTDLLFGKNGTYWRKVHNGPGDLSIDLHGGVPSQNESVILECHRRFNAVYIDTDIAEGPFQLAVAAVARKALRKAGLTGSQRWADVAAIYKREQGLAGTRSGGVMS